tara:strand:+ start:926 stop:1105 length:180 start_codon:yes stop_codon:yes gene_type:complete
MDCRKVFSFTIVKLYATLSTETTFFDKAETTASVIHVATPTPVAHECATFISGSVNSKL